MTLKSEVKVKYTKICFRASKTISSLIFDGECLYIFSTMLLDC